MRTKEKVSEYNKRQYLKNKAKIKIGKKIYYEKHKNDPHKKERETIRSKERMATLKGKITAWKSSAKLRGIEWNLNEEYINSLSMKCGYTGEILTLEQNKFNTVSLDRINNNKGYIEDNVVFCCSDINFMKSNLSKDLFISLCGKVAKHNQ